MAAADGPDGHDAAANLIWSAKESALKVLRTGLRADTRTVEVVLESPAGITAGAQRADGWQRLAVSSGRACSRAGGAATGCSCSPWSPPRAWTTRHCALPGSADLTTAEPIHSWVAPPAGRLTPEPTRRDSSLAMPRSRASTT